MLNRKREREVELGDVSAAPTAAKKCARLDKADMPVETYRHMRCISPHYEFALVIWSQPMTELQKCFLIQNMKEMAKLKSAADLINMPPYASGTTKPMDLSTMRSLLDNSGYSSVTDFITCFRAMVVNKIQLDGKHDAAAVRLFKCLCERMKYCPTGPDGKMMTLYARHDLKVMAAQITEVASHIAKQSSEKLEVIDIDDSDADGRDEVAGEPDTKESEVAFDDYNLTFEDIKAQYAAALNSTSLMQNETPTASGSGSSETLEPDDSDEETRQLQKEIERTPTKTRHHGGKEKTPS
jgi:hypothetical protein